MAAHIDTGTMVTPCYRSQTMGHLGLVAGMFDELGIAEVFTALEYRLRTALAEHRQTFPNQRGKPVANPTTRWIFQCFTGIHVLLIDGQAAMVLNLTACHQR